MKELTLINNEGTNLKLQKINKDNFIIIDEWDVECGFINSENVNNWLEGNFIIIDSQDRQWRWLDQSEDCRRILPEIQNFIK